MKRLLVLLSLLFCFSLSAQQNYDVAGETISLYTEVQGPLSLLWNTIAGEYRYFLKNGEEITELKNTKKDGDYQEEYKLVLYKNTNEDASQVKFTKPSLSKFIDTYNASQDSNYVSNQTKVSLKTRLGGFAGMTNYPYFYNPDNTSLPQIGAEFEVMDGSKLRRHSIVFQLRQLFGNKDYDFNSTQLNLNYRFKFIQSSALDLYVNCKIADYVYVSQDLTDGDGNPIGGSGGEFQAPFAFGIGADIALGNGYLTFQYQDLYAFNLEDNGEFPVDIAIGYKFNL